MSNQGNDLFDVATPPTPGNREIPKPQSSDPKTPQDSPYLKEGETPVWISCRATAECQGKYGVLRASGEMDLQAGGGHWRRYTCLTCGASFPVVL